MNTKVDLPCIRACFVYWYLDPACACVCKHKYKDRAQAFPLTTLENLAMSMCHNI